VTLQEAADLLGVHYMTAYRYVRLGLLPASKVGGTWQVEPADVEAMRRGGDEPAPGGRRNPAPWDKRLEARLLAGDETGAWGVVESALAAGSDPVEIHVEVLAPAMRRIGDAWAAGDVDVADEHRASVIASRLVGRLGPRFLRRGRTKGTVVLGAVQGERHGLPVAMLADLVRSGGYAVVDLGADVPVESFVRAVADTDALLAVGVSVTSDENLDDVAPTVEALRAVTDAPVLVGGLAVRDADHAAELGADGWAPDGLAVLEALAQE
jgi:excisionase family DNA binding protein